MADFEVNRRLKYLIKEVFKITPFAFSQKYNDNGGVKTSQVMRETNGLSNKLLEQIIGAYPEINRTWLLTGEGEMLKAKIEDVPTPVGQGSAMDTMARAMEIMAESNKILADSNRIMAENNAELVKQLSQKRAVGEAVKVADAG